MKDKTATSVGKKKFRHLRMMEAARPLHRREEPRCRRSENTRCLHTKKRSSLSLKAHQRQTKHWAPALLQPFFVHNELRQDMVLIEEYHLIEEIPLHRRISPHGKISSPWGIVSSWETVIV